jgi:hypothetical protein
MATYKQLNPDDTINIKGGEKFVVIHKDGLLPDGRLRPKGEDESFEDWSKYCKDQIAKVTSDMTASSSSVRSKLQLMFAMPDAVKKEDAGKRRKYVQDCAKMVDGHIKNFEADVRMHLFRQRMAVLRNLPLILEANNASRIHKIAESGEVFSEDNKGRFEAVADHTFVVKHNWLAVLGDTNPELDEWELPFDTCFFEFRVSGYTFVVYADNGPPKSFRVLAEASSDYWVTISEDYPVFKFLVDQIAAACVVLEAEVATKEVVRQPDALQAKRIKTGKPPMLDYHVIDLSRKRLRISNPTDPQDPPSHQKRLHFCRAHDRHLPSHTVRIPWCLKGNPELGFVDKLYKL